MKYLLIVADGAADYPLESRGGKTPLQAASMQTLERISPHSRMGQLVTVPEDMPPGSEIANLSLLGYDVHEVYQGRGVLEAASMGVDLHPGELAMRCNLICIGDDHLIRNHSAGHIPTEEARVLIEDLNREFSCSEYRWHAGVSYRHLFVLAGGSDRIACTPPHDVPGTCYRDVLVQASDSSGSETAALLNRLIESSREFLAHHRINRTRIKEGKDPANALWFWSPGYRPSMKTFQELYGKTGAVISAVDLIFGIGRYAGLDAVKVPGATGLYDTNYEGKAHAAIEALRRYDFVLIHVEASDEAGHEGDVQLKVRTLEYLDRRLLRHVYAAAAAMNEPVRIALLPDHPTPCELRTHVHDPVPVMIYTPGEQGDGIARYDEHAAAHGSLGLMRGDEFIKKLFSIDAAH